MTKGHATHWQDMAAAERGEPVALAAGGLNPSAAPYTADEVRRERELYRNMGGTPGRLANRV